MNKSQSYKAASPFKKFRVFISGLKLAIQKDKSVATQIIISLVVLSTCFWLREWLDFILILIVTGYMVIAELFNTALEWLCDYLQPNHDPRIGMIKDVAAAAVGLSIVIWLITLIFEISRLLPRISP